MKPLIKKDFFIMRHTLWFLVICILLVVPASGDYKIIKHTIGGGGRQSGGGTYIVTGTIAQPEAGYSAKSDYELLSGFWPGEPLCFVDFEHFSRFAKYWLEMGNGLPGDLI